ALSIRDAVTDTFAGEIGLYYQEPSTGQAMIGYDLDRPWRGRGYASRAVRLLTAWTFERTGIVRLLAGTAPDNVPTQRVLDAAGGGSAGRATSAPGYQASPAAGWTTCCSRCSPTTWRSTPPEHGTDDQVQRDQRRPFQPVGLPVVHDEGDRQHGEHHRDDQQ